MSNLSVTGLYVIPTSSRLATTLCRKPFPAHVIMYSRVIMYNIRSSETLNVPVSVACRFKLRKYLNTHLTLHTGVRQFKCTICEKDFNQKCELNRHMRHHNGEGAEAADSRSPR